MAVRQDYVALERGWEFYFVRMLQRCRAAGAGEKRWRAAAVQDMLTREAKRPVNAERLGVRQPSGALGGRVVGDDGGAAW